MVRRALLLLAALVADVSAFQMAPSARLSTVAVARTSQPPVMFGGGGTKAPKKAVKKVLKKVAPKKPVAKKVVKKVVKKVAPKKPVVKKVVGKKVPVKKAPVVKAKAGIDWAALFAPKSLVANQKPKVRRARPSVAPQRHASTRHCPTTEPRTHLPPPCGQVSKEVAAQKVKAAKLAQRKVVLAAAQRKQQLFAQRNPKAAQEQRKKQKIVDEQRKAASFTMSQKKNAFNQKKTVKSATFLDSQKRAKAAREGRVYVP